MSKYLDFGNFKNKLQLEREKHLAESAVPLTEKQKLSLYKKSQKSGYSTGILEEVYRRGYLIWKPELFEGSREQFAFDRVNSFVSGGFASNIDSDLLTEGKRGLWDNIHAKRKRIAAGSGERMRKPGSKGAPTDAAIKASQTEEADPCWDNYKQIGMKMKKGKKVPNCVPEEYTGAEKVSKDPNNPASRFWGTKQLTKTFKNDTPGEVIESSLSTIKKVVAEATYKGKKVPLNKPMKGDVKKSKVFVDPDGDGKAQKVNFGDKNMTIKKNDPERRKSFRARHGCDDPSVPKPKNKARYWSCRAW